VKAWLVKGRAQLKANESLHEEFVSACRLFFAL
jgi:hypothetical protein